MDELHLKTIWRNEENLAVILNSVGDALLATDAARRITVMNPVAEKLTGWTRSEALGRPIEDVFHTSNEETQPGGGPVDDVLAAGKVLISRGGRACPIASSAAPILDSENRAIGMMLAFRDVTEGRAREAELAQFKNVVDRTLDCVFMYRTDNFRFLYANEGGQRQVGYTEGEILRMTVLDIKPEFTVESFRRLVQPLLDAKQPSLLFQTVHRHKDGHTIPVEVYLQLVPDAGREPRFVNIVRDITERKQAEEALRKSEEWHRAIVHTALDGFLLLDAQG